MRFGLSWSVNSNMKRRLDQPPVVPATAARRRDLVFVYALLGSIVTCLLCALSMRLDRSAGANIGWPLQVLLCLIFIFVACFVYGLISKAMWQAMFGAVLGTCVGFFFGLGIVMAAPSDDLPKSQMRLSLAVHNHTADYIHQSYVGEAGSSNVRLWELGARMLRDLPEGLGSLSDGQN
jgi:hypothetical protein